MDLLAYITKAADATGSSLPPITIDSLPASEKNTLPGMTPPVSYTRVNTNAAPQMDAGALQQKSQPAMGMMALPKQAHVFSGEDANMNMTSRPLIQDLVKSAMDRSLQRSKIAEEAARQMRKADGDEDDKEKDSCGPGMKTASDETVSTEYAIKLAGAVEYIAKVAFGPAQLSEKVQQPPEGVMQTSSEGQLPGPGGYGKAHHQPPTNPGTQKAMPQEHGGTQLENTINQHVPGEQQTAMSGGHGKTASLAAKNVVALSKLASGQTHKKAAAAAPQQKVASSLVDAFLTQVKKAADENNPAKISAGAAVPPETSAAGEAGGAPVGGMPQGPRGLVHSNESAINYKKNQAYAPRKSELKAYLSEPALTSSTDSTLQAAFAHTGEAGTKMASAQAVSKVAEARALLRQISDRAAAQ